MIADDVQSSGDRWHRHLTPSFDRVFDLLIEEAATLFKADGELLEAISEPMMDLKREARQRETELNLAYAMRAAPVNRG